MTLKRVCFFKFGKRAQSDFPKVVASGLVGCISKKYFRIKLEKSYLLKHLLGKTTVNVFVFEKKKNIPKKWLVIKNT